MKKQCLLLIFTFQLFVFSGCSLFKSNLSGSSSPPAILVFTKTSGFYHSSIPEGVAAIQKLGTENNFRIDTTREASWFTTDSLAKYAAVVFLNTTGDVLNPEQEKAFENYIKSGGGYVGIHAASDTEFEWEWYNHLVGAQFESHPEIQEADILIVNRNHPSTSFLPDTWHRKDEWYNYKNIYPGIKVLARLDESSYSGSKNGRQHPFAWYHEYDGGRAFYTGGGHTAESYREPLFLQHLLGGINYAIKHEPSK